MPGFVYFNFNIIFNFNTVFLQSYHYCFIYVLFLFDHCMSPRGTSCEIGSHVNLINKKNQLFFNNFSMFSSIILTLTSSNSITASLAYKRNNMRSWKFPSCNGKGPVEIG